jgi:ribosome-binding factor A
MPPDDDDDNKHRASTSRQGQSTLKFSLFGCMIKIFFKKTKTIGFRPDHSHRFVMVQILANELLLLIFFVTIICRDIHALFIPSKLITKFISSTATSTYQSVRSTHLYANKFTKDDKSSDNKYRQSNSDDKGSSEYRPVRRQAPRPPSMQDNIKLARYARTLRDELSDIISNIDIKASNYPDDDLLRGTGIVDVEVSPDMMSAKIVISVLGNSVEKRKVYLWLCDNIGQVRYSLAKRLRNVRRIPTLSIKLMDPQTAEIMNIIEEEAMRRQFNANKIKADVEFEEEED